MNQKLTASFSLDLDNTWSYLKDHCDPRWKSYPSCLSTVVPIVLDFLASRELKLTFFVIGKDAQCDYNLKALKQLADHGHEIGNHSLNHEASMQNLGEDEIANELAEAQKAIERATGYKPLGFRGPGYCSSRALLNAVRNLGFEYDCSTLPSILSPVARIVLFRGVEMGPEDKDARKEHFGRFRDGYRPLKPFEWRTQRGDLLEIPVTTIPLLRVPFHMTYLMWLRQYSESLSLGYLRFALFVCRMRRIEPSFLLHSLDFLGKDDVPELARFPGMLLARKHKLEFLDKVMTVFQSAFDVVPMAEHARRIRKLDHLKTVPLADK
jgi:hypothetical protein